MVANNLFLPGILPTLSGADHSIPVQADPTYKYSDLGFYMIARIVERLSGQSALDAYVEPHFYQPLGLEQNGLQSWKHFL